MEIAVTALLGLCVFLFINYYSLKIENKKLSLNFLTPFWVMGHSFLKYQSIGRHEGCKYSLEMRNAQESNGYLGPYCCVVNL